MEQNTWNLLQHSQWIIIAHMKTLGIRVIAKSLTEKHRNNAKRQNLH